MSLQESDLFDRRPSSDDEAHTPRAIPPSVTDFPNELYLSPEFEEFAHNFRREGEIYRRIKALGMKIGEVLFGQDDHEKK